jgi:hypothetical protein
MHAFIIVLIDLYFAEAQPSSFGYMNICGFATFPEGHILGAVDTLARHIHPPLRRLAGAVFRFGKVVVFIIWVSGIDFVVEIALMAIR